MKTYPTEYQETVLFADWLRLKKIPFTHIVNESGGKGSPMYGAKLKRMGRSKGFPDFLIFVRDHEFEEYARSVALPENSFIEEGFIPIAIELKRQNGGRISPEQKNWLETLKRAGFYCGVCKGFEEAKQFIEDIL